jgi:Polymerase beta, Nucleotidyltransferase
LAGLTAAERNCVDRYVSILAAELGDRLEEVWLFGSAARGDMWADFWPMRSDVDLLVVTRDRLTHECEDKLCARTYEPYLECGRQISPAFRTRDQLRSEQVAVWADISREGVRLWPEGGSA